MLASPVVNSWGLIENNQDGGAATPGTAIPLGNGVEGSWTSVLTAATARIGFVVLNFLIGRSNATDRRAMVDFGWDPSGGTSYTEFLKDYQTGKASNANAPNPGDKTIGFPCDIPAGSRIALRGMDSVGGTNINVIAHFFEKPSHPELWPFAAYSETPGTYTQPAGISFTPGNASWGSWVSLGTLSKPCFWHDLSLNVQNSALTADMTLVEMAYGDSSNKHLILRKLMNMDTAENLSFSTAAQNTVDLPSGTELWVRGYCTGAPGSGYAALAHCFGG